MDIKGVCTVSLIAIVIIFSSVVTSHSATSKVRIFVYNPGYANIDTKIERVEASIKGSVNLNKANNSEGMQRIADYTCTKNQVCRVIIGNEDLSILSSNKVEEGDKIVRLHDKGEGMGKGMSKKSGLYIGYVNNSSHSTSNGDIYITLMP